MPPDNPRKAGSTRAQNRPVAGKEAAGDSDVDIGEVFFEFRPIGNFMRVNAIHAKTGKETYVLGPLNTPRSNLQMLALRKLRIALSRNT